jgi:hypothetical protein
MSRTRGVAQHPGSAEPSAIAADYPSERPITSMSSVSVIGNALRLARRKLE